MSSQKTREWIEPVPTGIHRLAVHGRIFQIEADAVVRHAGRITFVLYEGNVRALGAEGEMVLQDFEKLRIWEGFVREGLVP